MEKTFLQYAERDKNITEAITFVREKRPKTQRSVKDT